MTKNDSDYTAKFTIGERVKVVDNVGIIGHGTRGVITDINRGRSLPYLVQLDHPDPWTHLWYREWELQRDDNLEVA